MANQDTYSVDKSSSTILRKSLVAFILLFLLITPAYGQACSPEIWASDCYIHVNKNKTSMYIYVECSKKASAINLKMSSTGYPKKNGALPEVEQEITKSNIKFGVFVFDNLKINTMYNYVLTVWDSKLCQTFASGGLGTAQRNFTLSLKKILVYDDGDDGPAGKGELELYVRVRESSKPVPYEVIRFGSQSSGWAESGKSYTVGKSLKLSNMMNPGVEIIMKAIENDTTGSIFDSEVPEDLIDVSSSDRFIDLKEWEKNDKYFDDWSTTLLGSPKVKLMFKGWLEYEKGEHGHSSYPDIQSIKPKTAAQPESLDQIKKLVFIPLPPEITEPIANKSYLDVPVDIDIRTVGGPVWNPITALEVDFNYGQVDESSEKKVVSWTPETMIFAGGTILEDTIDHHTFKYPMPNAKFTKKGLWRLRARAIPQKGDASNWSQWRFFSVISSKDVPEIQSVPDSKVSVISSKDVPKPQSVPDSKISVISSKDVQNIVIIKFNNNDLKRSNKHVVEIKSPRNAQVIWSGSMSFPSGMKIFKLDHKSLDLKKQPIGRMAYHVLINQKKVGIVFIKNEGQRQKIGKRMGKPGQEDIKTTRTAAKPLKPKLDIALSLKNKNLKVGNKATILISVKNNGKGTLNRSESYSLHCSSRCPFNRGKMEFNFNLEPGNTRSFRLISNALAAGDYDIIVKTKFGSSKKMKFNVKPDKRIQSKPSENRRSEPATRR